jgi:multicomponent Na+:H+ antiporter subunit D
MMTMTASVHPALIFFLGALAVALLRGRAQSVALVLVPVAGALNLLGLAEGEVARLTLFDYTLTPLRADRLALLFTYVFHLATFIGVIFALNVRDTGQHVAALLYAGSALGAVLAGDLITLFIFWELLAVTSVFLIFARRTSRAIAAGFRYLIIQVGSGLVLLAGVLVHVQQTGSVAFEFIGLEGLASWLIFLAFGVKCAFPFLHNWLTDAYPEATPSGTVFLSAFTTKVAVYALARGYPGTELLLYIGATMTAFPIFFAVIENDLRRVLSYSIINQVGFMVTGIGIGTEMALNGTTSHAFAHIIYKALLLMSTGSVLFMTGRINGSDLGGLYRTMPVTAVFCIIGAASISAFPLFSGFVAKSMVMTAALEEGHGWIWLVLLFASAGVFHHAGIKVPFFAFFAHDSGIRAKEPPLNMLVAMGLAAFLCVFIGCYPWLLYDVLPFPVDYHPFDSTHVVAQLQLLFFSALAFTWLKLTGLYPPELPSVNIDVEWLYRRAAPRLLAGLAGFVGPIDLAFRRIALVRLERTVEGVFWVHGPRGRIARTWETGSKILTVVLMFVIVLLLTYL